MPDLAPPLHHENVAPLQPATCLSFFQILPALFRQTLIQRHSLPPTPLVRQSRQRQSQILRKPRQLGGEFLQKILALLIQPIRRPAHRLLPRRQLRLKVFPEETIAAFQRFVVGAPSFHVIMFHMKHRPIQPAPAQCRPPQDQLAARRGDGDDRKLRRLLRHLANIPSVVTNVQLATAALNACHNQ